MKLVILCLCVAAAVARPQDTPPAELLRLDSTQNEDGSFQYAFETSDPITVEAAGQAKQIGEEIGVVMQGSYSFETPDGQTITINWVADENGFQPQGDAIPVAPAV
ncbi:larval cuticle protein 65Ag1-like [Amphibalanus amphitrite]|uniref:larval cuticle protein 65Ag1-like n=1 Tax=Amphibalanus amphitrite TaxID=1232801 RepID=UPI001C905A67|nr:larval cuticle protein 65Ag1-like [Amphibalanus amphitrite]XP_043239243.1 larval cuticle protein 65Ag1-like [Amphibalanus amphitrite]